LQLDSIWVECGTSDDLYLSNIKFSQALDSAGINHKWVPFKGGHVDMVGQRIQETMLPFFSEVLIDTLITEVENAYSNFSSTFILMQNYPNPFNPTTAISYQLSALSQVDLSIYNILGQKVATLVSEKQPAGDYKVEWDASGFASGIYLYHLQTDEFSETRKMILLQ